MRPKLVTMASEAGQLPQWFKTFRLRAVVDAGPYVVSVAVISAFVFSMLAEFPFIKLPIGLFSFGHLIACGVLFLLVLPLEYLNACTVQGRSI